MEKGFSDRVDSQADVDALNINVVVWDANGKIIERYDDDGQPLELDGEGNVVIGGVKYPMDNDGVITFGVATGENYVPPEEE